MNTKLDKDMCNVDDSIVCKMCGNYPATTPTGLYCVRCNLTLPKGFTRPVGKS